MYHLTPEPIARVVRRLSVSEPDIRQDPPGYSLAPPQQYHTDDYSAGYSSPYLSASTPFRGLIRRLSMTRDTPQPTVQHNRPATNEYFRQMHPEAVQADREGQATDSNNNSGLVSGFLTPLGTAIRRLSGTESNLRSTIPSNETQYLQQLHDAAIAAQNAQGRNGEQQAATFTAPNLVYGLKDRIGTVIRRLSTYEDDPRNKMSSQDAFQLFQEHSDEHESLLGTHHRRRHHSNKSHKVPEINIEPDSDAESQSGGRKKNRWKKLDLFRQAIGALSNRNDYGGPKGSETDMKTSVINCSILHIVPL